LTGILNRAAIAKWDASAIQAQRDHRREIAHRVSRAVVAEPFAPDMKHYQQLRERVFYAFRYGFATNTTTPLTRVTTCQSRSCQGKDLSQLSRHHLAACKAHQAMATKRHTVIAGVLFRQSITALRQPFHEVLIDTRASAIRRGAKTKSGTFADFVYQTARGEMEAVDVTIRQVPPGRSLKQWSDAAQAEKRRRYNGIPCTVHALIFTPFGMPDKKTDEWLAALDNDSHEKSGYHYHRYIVDLSKCFYYNTAATVAMALGATPSVRYVSDSRQPVSQG
jgi:hypothetical protein